MEFFMKIFLIFFMFFWSGCSFSDSLFSYDFIQVSYYEVDHFSDSVVYDDGYSLDYFGGIDEDKFIYASFGVLNNHNRNMMVVISPALILKVYQPELQIYHMNMISLKERLDLFL